MTYHCAVGERSQGVSQGSQDPPNDLSLCGGERSQGGLPEGLYTGVSCTKYRKQAYLGPLGRGSQDPLYRAI